MFSVKPQQRSACSPGATKVQRVAQEGEPDPKDVFNGTHALLKCLAVCLAATFGPQPKARALSCLGGGARLLLHLQYPRGGVAGTKYE